MQTSLAEINARLSDRLQDEELNFCNLFQSEIADQVSVTGKYEPVLGKEYIKLNPDDLNQIVSTRNYSRYYYGASPKIDGPLVIPYIAELKLKDENGILAFLKEHHNDFALHKGDEKYLLSISKYILLSICGKFGITFDFETEEKAVNFRGRFTGYENVLLQNKNEVIIRGCPTQELLDALTHYKYERKTEERNYGESDGEYYHDRWIVTDADPQKTENTLSIEDVYKKSIKVYKKSIHVIGGNEFYSGVLFRPLKIEEELYSSSNQNAAPVVISFERSTYGTVYAFDNNLINHPLLNEHDKQLITEFFKNDDKQKRELSKRLRELSQDEKYQTEMNYHTKMLEAINTYLENSNNVNQICIAATLKTQDDYLFCCQRGKNSIDKGKLYPSVNGNAEMIDADVEYYKKSVNVDFPSADLHDIRIDFNGELTREANAELGLNLPNEGWICYGIAMLGTMPQGGTSEGNVYPYRKRRMHFSIIMHQSTDENLTAISEKQKKSTENHETKRIYGFKLVQHGKILKLIGMLFKMAINFFAKMQNVILAFFTILCFFLTAHNFSFWDSITDWENLLSLFFSIPVVIVVLLNVGSWIITFFKNKRTRKIIIAIHRNDEARRKILINKLEKFLAKRSVYPITYLLFYCYIYYMQKEQDTLRRDRGAGRKRRRADS